VYPQGRLRSSRGSIACTSRAAPSGPRYGAQGRSQEISGGCGTEIVFDGEGPAGGSGSSPSRAPVSAGNRASPPTPPTADRAERLFSQRGVEAPHRGPQCDQLRRSCPVRVPRWRRAVLPRPRPDGLIDSSPYPEPLLARRLDLSLRRARLLSGGGRGWCAARAGESIDEAIQGRHRLLRRRRASAGSPASG
jgi:hypothetical protein